MKNHPAKSATLDVDAVISTSSKHTAFYTYKKEPEYQPMNAYWNEQGLVVHTEFLDGIVYVTIFQYGMNEKMRKMNAKLQKFNNI